MKGLAWLVAVVLLSGCAAMPTPGGDVDSQRTRAEDPERVIVLAIDNPLEPETAGAGTGAGGYATVDGATTYRVSAQAQTQVRELAQRHGLTPLDAWPIDALRWHCVTLRLAPGQSRDDVLARLQADPDVRLAQPLNRFQTHQLPVPSAPPAPSSAAPPAFNDPYLPLQAALQRTQGAAALRLATGRGVKLALVDTGVDRQHPDLRQASVRGRNFVNADDPAFARDPHGTELAGLIAATPNNGEGIVGMAPNVELTVYKACWHEKPGAPAQCNSLTLALALAALLGDGAQVVNLSLSGPADALLEKLLSTALARGLVVVAAVPPDGNRQGFPLRLPGVIAVDLAERPHGHALAAPGQQVLTLSAGGGYGYASVSSLATAQVSAVVALLLQVNPKLDAAAVAALLERSQAGGVVNACQALRNVMPQGQCGL